MQTEQHPIRSDAAERAVIGSILVLGASRMSDAVDDVLDRLRPENFTQYPLRMLFETAVRLREGKIPITMESVYVACERAGSLPDLGDNPARCLADLWQSAGAGLSLGISADSVIDAALLRRFHLVGLSIAAKALDPDDATKAMIADAYGQLFDLEANEAGSGEPVPARQLAAEMRARIEEMLRGGSGDKSFMRSGMTVMDGFAAFRPGQLVILGARPSVGKSAFMLQLLRGLASSGYPGMFISLEMTRRELGERITSAISRVPMPNITGRDALDHRMADSAIDATDEFAAEKTWFSDCSNQTVARIASTGRRYARNHGVRVLCLDYVQLVRPTNPKENRNQQVGEITRALKILAKDSNILVVAAAQLNREIESRPDQSPKLSDLRDSGEIEQHADTVIFMSRAAGIDVDKIAFNVAKNRSGQCGSWVSTFEAEHMKFYEDIPGGFHG